MSSARWRKCVGIEPTVPRKAGPLDLKSRAVTRPHALPPFPFLERLYQRFSGGSAQFVGVSQDSPEDTAEFCQEYGLSFPMLVDHEDYVASSAYGLHFVPTIFLIQPSGEIQISSEGFCKVDFLAIHSELSKVASANGALFQEIQDKV